MPWSVHPFIFLASHTERNEQGDDVIFRDVLETFSVPEFVIDG